VASISPINRDGKITGYRVIFDTGPDGKRKRKAFKTYAEAQSYKDSTLSDRIGTKELYDHRAEFVRCLQKVTEVNATLEEAVEFFLRHGARKKNPAIIEVINEFIDDKEQAGRKKMYLAGMRDMWNRFAGHIGYETHLADITTEVIKDYVYVTQSAIANVTKNNYLRSLSVLFNYGIRKKYLSINPVTDIDRPKVKFRPPAVMTPADFSTLLHRCAKKQWYDRLTIFVLTGFCGVRDGEAQHLTWADIDMENKKVTVPDTIAKASRFRRNTIPENAMKWLRLGYDARRTGPIIGKNARALLRSAVRYAHIGYSQNCLRHSFASYSIEAGVSKEEVASALGHAGSLKVLFDHYRNVVETEAAKQWFEIVPTL
jgi:integrase